MLSSFCLDYFLQELQLVPLSAQRKSTSWHSFFRHNMVRRKANFKSVCHSQLEQEMRNWKMCCNFKAPQEHCSDTCHPNLGSQFLSPCTIHWKDRLWIPVPHSQTSFRKRRVERTIANLARRTSQSYKKESNCQFVLYQFYKFRDVNLDYFGWTSSTSKTSSLGISKYSGSCPSAARTRGRMSHRVRFPFHPSFSQSCEYNIKWRFGNNLIFKNCWNLRELYWYRIPSNTPVGVTIASVAKNLGVPHAKVVLPISSLRKYRDGRTAIKHLDDNIK